LNSKIKKLFQLTLILLSFVFIVVVCNKNIEALKNKTWSIDWGIMSLSIMLNMLVGAGQFNVWHVITKTLKCAIPMKIAMRCWYVSQLGKYIPGKVFMLFYRFAGYSKENKIKLSISFYLETLFALLAAGCWSLCFVFILTDKSELLSPYYLILIIPVLMIFCHHKVINFIVQKLLKVLKKETEPINVNWFQYCKIFSLNLLNWFILGIAFFVFTNAFIDCGIDKLFLLTGILATSVILGMISIFSPAGIGVRESLLILLLSYIFEIEIAIVIALTSRLWFTFGELLSSILVVLLIKKGRVVQEEN
jgi:glycosyltransferase 2 family protein